MIVQAKHYELGVYKSGDDVDKHDIQAQSGWKAEQLHMCNRVLYKSYCRHEVLETALGFLFSTY